MLKALVISSKHPPATSGTKAWLTLQQDDDFVKGIVTPDITLEDTDVINRLVSGIPSPIARERATVFALNQIEHADPSGVDRVFKLLVDEWKGLLSCIALDGQHLSVKKISLNYSDGATPKDTNSSVFELKGAFANVIASSQEAGAWRKACGSNAENDGLYIDVIKFQEQVVGGTSPNCFLFTSPGYDLREHAADYPFIHRTRGKFTDPVENGINAKQAKQLYAYLSSVEAALGKFPYIRAVITPWKRSLEKKARALHIDDLNRPTLLPNFEKFTGFYGEVLNYRTELRGNRGKIYQKSPETNEYISTNFEDLLLPEGYRIAEIEVDSDSQGKISHKALEVPCVIDGQDGGKKKILRYFSLPLTEKGALILMPSLRAVLVGENETHLTAFVNDKGASLRVTLTAKVAGGGDLEVVRNYPIAHLLSKKIVVWPDFRAKEWTAYYLYSEYALAQEDVMAIPVYADRDSGELKTDNGNPLSLRRAAGVDADFKVEKLLEHDEKRLGSGLVYEISKSNHPVIGVQLKEFDTKNSCGYIFLATDSDRGERYDVLAHRTDNNPKEVVLGIDFGSNNISMSYSEGDGRAASFMLNSRRLSIVGKERSPSAFGTRPEPSPAEVFFMQIEPTQSNSIKSMLTLHSDSRVKGGPLKLEDAVTGGLPVFEKGLPIHEATDSRLTTSVKSTKTFIHYNMKWREGDNVAQKKALIRSLILKASAELFADGAGIKTIKEVRWAYPSAMRRRLREQYIDLWNDIPIGVLNSGNPADRAFSIATGITESVAVSKYAVSDEGRARCKNDNLFIGLDVGGSTTDILVITQRQNATLVKQASVRFAAGEIANLTRGLPEFRQFLVKFCERQRINVPGLNTADRADPKTHPYYYNLVMDAIQDKETFAAFYRRISIDFPALFACNIYMCGAIFFYCGQISRRIADRRRAEEPQIKSITVRSFGKGGRIFDWLTEVYPEEGRKKFKQWFEAGFGLASDTVVVPTFELLNSHVPAEDVKCEVSKGLSLRSTIDDDDASADEIVGEHDCSFVDGDVKHLDSVDGKFIESIGNNFALPMIKVQLESFIDIFRNVCLSLDLRVKLVEVQELRQLPYENFIRNQPEYLQAVSEKQEFAGEDFSYKPSLFMLEVMCAMEKLKEHNFK